MKALAEEDIEKFSVRLYREKGGASVVWSYNGTRLNCLEYEEVEKAWECYRTIVDTVKDVLHCKAQEAREKVE